MIRINLLPTRAVKKQEAGRNQLILFALVLIAALGGNYYWYSDRDAANGRVKADIDTTQKEINDLDRIIGEVKNIAVEKQALEDKLKVLDQLKKSRTGPVKMLDAMATAIPKNVWLTAMTENNGAMSLEGQAVSNDDLAEYMKNLAAVVWTEEGIGRLVQGSKKGGTSAQVEIALTGQVKDLPVEKVSPFFTDISLRRAARAGEAVGFSLTCATTYSL